MKLSEFIEGLQILAPYYKGETYCLSAEHDIIHARATDERLPDSAVRRLYKLGWIQPEVDYDDGSKVKNYDPSVGWAAFT